MAFAIEYEKFESGCIDELSSMLDIVEDYQIDWSMFLRISTLVLKNQYDHKVVLVNFYQNTCSWIHELESQVQECKFVNEDLTKHIENMSAEIAYLAFGLQSLEKQNVELQS